MCGDNILAATAPKLNGHRRAILSPGQNGFGARKPPWGRGGERNNPVHVLVLPNGFICIYLFLFPPVRNVESRVPGAKTARTNGYSDRP